MINYQLYIENQLMDVDEKLSFPLNKILEELNDPTLIKTEWSKTVQLPMTDNNNLFFGNYFRLDNVTVADVNGSISGVYFDPTQKLNFRIVYNSDIVMEGYAKMLSNNNSSRKKAYELSLYGKLGEVLNKIKNISLNPTDENYIGDVLTPGLKLNKELVKASIDRSNPTLDLATATDVDIIGFAITNRGLYDEFDSKTFQYINSFETIDGFINKYKNVTDSNMFFPDGMNEHEVKELRSYYQKPYVYVNKVIQLIKNWINNNTDYTLNLSDTWFNINNPYWTRLIMMTKQVDVKKVESLINRYVFYGMAQTTIYPGGDADPLSGENTYVFELRKYTFFPIPEQKPILNSSYNLEITDSSYDYIITEGLKHKILVTHTTNSNIRFGLNNGLIVTYYTVPLNGAPALNYEYKIMLTGPGNQNLNLMKNTYDEVVELNFQARVDKGNYNTSEIVIPNLEGKHLIKGTTGEYRTAIRIEPLGYYNLFTEADGDSIVWSKCEFDEMPGASFVSAQINKNKRSQRPISFNDFFPVEYKLSDILFNYVKMFNLMFDINYQNKTINIIDKTNYFKSYEIEDWTDKIDRTQDMIQVPNSFESKYVVLNYDDSENKLNKDYKEKYKVNYGSYKLTTRYSFNDETKELFKGLKTSVVSSEPYLSFSNILNDDYKKYISNLILPAIYKSDGNKKTETDAFGQFYFRNRNEPIIDYIGVESKLYLSDDTTYMTFNDNYCYGDISSTSKMESKMLPITHYPLIDIVYSYMDIQTSEIVQPYGCVFQKPAETYSTSYYVYVDGIDPNTKYIYDACWKNWINERYNVDSKVLTAYFDLNLVDYNLFKFKKFIRIGNTLYSVNKIYDFDVNALKSTKVELLRVTDINNYLNANVDFSI